MKVAFWENSRKSEMDTDNMAAISTVISINSNKKVILFDNGQNNNLLERSFRGIHRFYYVKEDTNYLVHCNGMDHLFKDFYHVQNRELILHNSAVEVIQDCLYYVPPTKVINQLAYEYGLYQELSNIINNYEKLYDLIMIRVKNGDNLSTKHILDQADLILVEIDHDDSILEQFFDNYASIRHKALFVFRQYPKKNISIHKICSKYHIQNEQFIILTQHQPLWLAYLGGTLVSYLKSNNNCNKESEHYRCIYELRRAANSILRQERKVICEAIM